jgi:hypothetical protein
MNFKSFKTLALLGSAVIGLSLAPGVANADPDDDVTAAIQTSTTITATAGAVMDFGIWLIGIPASNVNSSTLVMDPQTGGVTPTTGGGHQLIALTGSTPAFGTVSVVLPTGADGLTLQMSHGALTPALGAGLVLSDISYYNPDTPAQTGVMTASTQVPITITTGDTGVAVQFGGTITASGSTPTDGPHGETFNVAFAY